MKKIIFLLLISIACYGQAEFPEGINLGGNTATAETSKLVSQQPIGGALNYVNATALPISAAAQNALDMKLNISDLPTNLILYPTTTVSDVPGYEAMVKDIHDVRYDEPAVDVSTPAITSTGQLVSSLIADAGVLIGQPGIFNVTTVGGIRRLSGSGVAEFYYKVFHRNSAGTETLVATSSLTPAIAGGTYAEFSASGVWDDGTFTETDRIVIKYYANRVAGGSDPVYQFLFGGATPVRTLLPVPFSVVDAGYEVKANKSDSYTVSSPTTYASTKALVDGLALKAPLASPTFTGTVSGITKSMVGLSAVNNTSDASKPVSTAQQTALNLKADLVSPSLTGTPTAPTATAGTNTTQLATTAFVLANAGSAPDATASVKGIVKLANDLGGTADLPTTPTAVHKGGNEVITGTKTFNPTSDRAVIINSIFQNIPAIEVNCSGNGTGMSITGEASSSSLLLAVQNNGNYFGIASTNTSSGVGIFSLNTSAVGTAISSLIQAGSGIVTAVEQGGTGIPFTVKDYQTVTLTIGKQGNVVSSGTVTASAFYQSSDIRLKNKMRKSYSNVGKIDAIQYTWKDTSKGVKPQVGYSAQQVRRYIPNAVEKDEQGNLSVNYIQVLIAKIEELEIKVKQLEKK